MIKLSQGAEAILYKDNAAVIKERFSKAYRLQHLDDSLRKFRTRREAKVLTKLGEMDFPAPKMQSFSDKRMSIVMDFVPGETLKHVLKHGDEFHTFAKEIGQKVGILHKENIVHGDLTTSNMIVNKKNHQLTFIDFGLSSFSEKIEDKAVDLFLLDRALEGTHFEFYPEIFEDALKGYEETNPESKDIINRLEEVKKRGRNKKRD
ncbi:Kae1-associated serine/threonine protein kinase [Candidatus Woesearchaeota archaeon]|jgi:TP53 regulating kinase and related kinases|nr:Kae1-associated serine/threonine protein kinase [Candidatus Woesearchaeota archaeon]MBT5396909.1 Kae1-associated serine/threonine protein kinase [Candidatus Woesearchaeota archaeon]MBT6367102.1 Kae1-associated serine/threonine protein kinase [Candidatus Woesearchaeota archaeon]MBT7762324.1 Kae1-associated serine/threonine protein kinase [Candidatus Woesearchaeota archaeon]